MTKPLQIIIVGGGTAGWMCGAALTSIVRPDIAKVRLIESDDIGTVGVGEATLPQMKDFNDYIGIFEADMMARTNATFKLGIEFVDWGFKGSSYIHPFGVHGRTMASTSFHHHWVRAHKNGHSSNIEDYSFAIAASRRNKFEFPAEDKRAVNSTYAYAYHLDATLYARYLRKMAERKGLARTEGKIVDVLRDGTSGHITAVKLESGEVVEGDLFVDCSGFRALLIGDALGNGYEDWTKWLPCDRALAVPSRRGDGPLLPYTRATAREAGWQWRIPLQHRTGNGYVYSSQFIDDDKAAETLLGALDGEALDDPRPIRFQAGRRTTSWDKNCIAIGLSSGFLEPLESTSIYLIQTAVMSLLKLLPGKTIDPMLPREFNRRVDLEYERVRDFLILHYYANTRDDAELWQYCREMDVPDSLKEKIENFRHRGHIPYYRDGLFAPPSWISVYVGQGLMPRDYDRLADHIPLSDMLGAMDEYRNAVSGRVEAMRDHDVFVRDYCQSMDEMAAPRPSMGGSA